MSSRWQLKYIRRRREIVGTFMRHGLGYFLQIMGFQNRIATKDNWPGGMNAAKNKYLLAVNLREALVELGPTFVKLGQLFSTRPDILPPVFIKELEKLQDKVEPISWDQLRQVINQEMGSLENIFARFDQEPLAAASIGQVHRARLLTGEEVIVKVQRPGIEAKVRNDFEIIKGLARISERRSTVAQHLGILAMVEDYRRSLLRELDYEREAASTERMYKNFAADDRVVIPHVFKEFSSPRILVQEYIDGIKLSDIEKIDQKGLDRRKISALGTEAFLSQIMVHGFFQADPHPGNILAVDNQRIAFIDFGEMGYLSDLKLAYAGEMMIAITQNEPYKAMSLMRDMGILDRLEDGEDFSESFAELVQSLNTGSIGSLDMRRFRNEIMEFAYRYHLQMPPYLTLLMKALITVEGLGKKLDADFDFMEVASPLAKKVYRERLKPSQVGKYLRSRYYKDFEPLKAVPSNFNRLLQETADGRLNVNLNMNLSPQLYHQTSQMVSRLSFSLIITGTLIGSAMIVQANHGDLMERFAFLGVIGFGIALISMVAFFMGSLK